ncbi:DNA ligase-associated DEXH box helicase, partial [Pseudomonas syringae]
ASEIDWAQALQADLFSETDLLADIIASRNAGELALRRSREIARISGLVFSGYPGAAKSNRQLQASSGLCFEVFKQYDADNMLLTQAEQEVLRQELDRQRRELTLRQVNSRTRDLHAITRAAPLAVPLLVGRFRERRRSEKLAHRIARRDPDR